MRTTLRALAVTAAATLATFGLLPAAQAKPPAPPSNQPVFEVFDGYAYEYNKTCTNTQPFSCGTSAGRLLMQVGVQNRPSPLAEITVGWQIEPLTATPGVDFTGPTSGTLTIPTYSSQVPVVVPLVVDGLAEPTETFRLRLTSSSVGGTFTDTGIGNIWNDGQIPADCTLNRLSTYTDRPSTQQWRLVQGTPETGWGVLWAYGNIVTGNGTSTATTQIIADGNEAYFQLA
jgi:hypothetical protein